MADHSFDEEETERGCRNDGNVRAAHGRFIGGNALLFALDCTLRVALFAARGSFTNSRNEAALRL